jgi:phosphonate transport system permease protein
VNKSRRISLIPREQQFLYPIIIGLSVLLFIFSWNRLQLNWDGSLSNILKAFGFIRRMLGMDVSEWRDVLVAAGESFSVAVLATIISAAVAFLVSFMAAANVSHRCPVLLCKGLAAGIRAVPTLIWTLIFVAYLGLGPFPGVLGLCFHSFAYLVKAFSQSIEEVSPEKIEALKATGASWVQIMARGVFPSVQTAFISWTALRFEFNVGMSTVLGLVGAGGIGHELTLVMRSFAFEKAGFVILIIFLMSFGIEMTFHKLKINVDRHQLNENSHK